MSADTGRTLVQYGHRMDLCARSIPSFHGSIDNFINKYQMGLPVFPLNRTELFSRQFVSAMLYPTVNYHTIPTSPQRWINQSLPVLCQLLGKETYHHDQSADTWHHRHGIHRPFLASSNVVALFRYDCHVSLFSFHQQHCRLGLFMSVLIMTIIQERVSQSKDLQTTWPI